MRWDHVIKNGTLVTASSSYKANIYIKDEIIEAITSCELSGEAVEVTDAGGKYLMPGFIDTHTHSRDGINGAHYKEDFFHSTMAAAAGGFTTIYEMPNCNPAIYNVDNFNKLVECVTPKANVDFGVWGLCLGDINNDQILPLAEAGVVGFKFFWGYALDLSSYQLIYNYTEGMENVLPPLSEGHIYKIFREVARTDKKLAIHAEHFDIIRILTEEVKASGDKSYAAMLRARPAMAETTVINTAISLSRELNTKLHILHLAVGDSVELIRNAQAQGLNVTCETCPQFLALTDKHAQTLGAVMKGYPLVRTQYDQDLLWGGIKDGTIALVCSDHAPHSLQEKQKPLWDAPAGILSLETEGLIMLNAVNEGRLSINRLVDVLSEQPAKLFGAYPQKGSLEVGTHADIVIVDMDMEYVFNQQELHSRTKLSPYDGWKLKGKPVKTILRGKTIMENGQIMCKPGGKLIRV